jgi:hypothetical protein
MDTYNGKKFKLAAFTASKIENSKWNMYTHYLIGKNGKIKYLKEVHKFVFIDKEDYEKAIRKVGLKQTKYLKKKNVKHFRNLFVLKK